MNQQTTYIYGLQCPFTDKIRYIGKSDTPKKRLITHISEAKIRNKTYRHHWINKIIEAGSKPIVIIIEEVLENDWREREVFWISYYSLRSDLVNDTEGGDGMTSQRAKALWENPEYRNKQIEAATGTNNHFFGRTHSEETRQILAVKCRHEIPWNKGKHDVYSQEYIQNNRLQGHRKPFGRYTKDGELVDTWESARDMARELQWDRRQIQRVLKGEKHFNFIKGYTLRYL